MFPLAQTICDSSEAPPRRLPFFELNEKENDGYEQDMMLSRQATRTLVTELR